VVKEQKIESNTGKKLEYSLKGGLKEEKDSKGQKGSSRKKGVLDGKRVTPRKSRQA